MNLQRASKEVSGFRSLTTVGDVGRFRKMRQYYNETLSNAVEKVDNA